jgi:hypothetical protein
MILIGSNSEIARRGDLLDCNARTIEKTEPVLELPLGIICICCLLEKARRTGQILANPDTIAKGNSSQDNKQ